MTPSGTSESPAPTSVTMWVCPSSQHVYKDKGGQANILGVTGTAHLSDDGSEWLPLCQGRHDNACGDRRCRAVLYLRAGETHGPLRAAESERLT